MSQQRLNASTSTPPKAVTIPALLSLVENDAIELPQSFKFEDKLLRRNSVQTLDVYELDYLKQSLQQWFLPKPEVTLSDLKAQIESGKFSTTNLDLHLRYYFNRRHRERMPLHFLFLASHCLRQARRQNQKQEQIRWLFHAVDLLRQYVQYGMSGTDLLAAGTICHIMSVLPAPLSEKFFIEQEIYHNIVQLFKIRKQAASMRKRLDHMPTRARLGRLFLKQGCFYDAYYQYCAIADHYGSQSGEDLQAWINQVKAHLWAAGVIQEIIHCDTPNEGVLWKLFIDRYNRDHTTEELPYPLPKFSRNDLLVRRRIQKALIRVANKHYRRIESLDKDLDQVGMKIPRIVMETARSEQFGKQLPKLLEKLKDDTFASPEEFQTAIKTQLKAHIAEKHVLYIRYLFQLDTYNRTSKLKQGLKSNPDWCDLIQTAMQEMARNYEFLELGDQALSCLQHAWKVLQPQEGKHYFQAKKELLTRLKRLCYNRKLSFPKTTERQRREEIAMANREISKIDRAVEEQNRLKHRSA